MFEMELYHCRYDECHSPDHGCEHECINTLGGYSCSCRLVIMDIMVIKVTMVILIMISKVLMVPMVILAICHHCIAHHSQQSCEHECASILNILGCSCRSLSTIFGKYRR